MRRKLCSALALAALLALARPAAPVDAQSTPIEIPVMLSLTGDAAFLGQAQATTLHVIESMTNAHGGIKGRPVRFDIQDTQSNPALAVQFMNGWLAKRAPLIIGPGFTAECLAVAPLIRNTLVDYCLSPAVTPPAGSSMYSASLDARAYPVLLLRYFLAKHYTRIALITSTDASGQAFDMFFDQAMARPEFKALQVVEREHFAVTDMSAVAQLSRMKGALPSVAIEWTASTAFGTLLRGTEEVGLNVPIAGGAGNASYTQMAQYTKFLPHTLIFPSISAVAPGGVGPGPIRDAQNVYFSEFHRRGMRADFLDGGVWDAGLIAVNAYRAVGPAATAEQLQNYVQHLHGWAGITGVYDFRDGSQRGIGVASGIVAQWDPAKNDFVAITHLGGLPK